MNNEDFKRKLTAILSADVVGYSRLMGEDEESTVITLNKYKKMISGLVTHHNGRVVDSPGDNLLAEFASVVDAVRCGVQIQEDLKVRNEELQPNRKMLFRIGINIGDVIQDGDRIYGDGINVAARIESLADPGGICISRRTYDHVKTRLDFGYEYLGEHNVKNISEPVRVYRVLMDSENAGKVVGEKKASKMVSRRLAMTTFIVLIIIAAGSPFWNNYSQQFGKTEQASEAEQTPAVVDVEENPKTIAVLPFEDLSPEKDQGYFVDGLTDEISIYLGQIPELKVAGMTSAFSFKGSNKTVQEITNILGVENILVGSVRKVGNALRITAKLLQGSDGSQLWSEKYDKEFKVEEMYSVQEDIANAVGNKLKVTLGVGESPKLGGTDNEKAYEYYLVAKGQQFDITAISRALETIDAAIAMDPEFARAWALKATLHILQTAYGPSDLAGSQRGDALYAAGKAIGLDPNLAAGYVSLGYTTMGKGDWVEAESVFHKALEISVGTLSSDEVIYTAIYNMGVGYFRKAANLLAEWRRKDPLNPNLRAIYLFPLVVTGDNQRAEEEFEQGMKLFGGEWGGYWFYLGSNIRPGIKISAYPDKINVTTPQGQILAIGVKNSETPEKGLAELRQMYQDEKNLSSSEINMISIIAAYLGDLDFAMDAMEKGYEIDPGGMFMSWSKAKMEVRHTARFKEFVRKIGLVDYWEKFGWPDLCHPTDHGDFVCD